MTNISKETTELRGKLKDQLEYDAKAKTLSVKEGAKLYDDNRPELLKPTELEGGVTFDPVKATKDYDTTFAAALAGAVGDAGIDAMKSDKKLDRLTITVDAGAGDKITVSQVRAHDWNVNGNTGTTHGALKVNFDHASGRNSGDLKRVKDSVTDAAAEAFGK